MKILTTFFSQLLEMSVTASSVIIAVLLVRCLLQRLPKKYSYCLWAVVLFRLLCPVSISSVFSIFNLGGYEWKRFLGLTDVTEAENVVMLPSEEITVTEFVGGNADAVTMHEYMPGVYEYAAVDSAVPMWLQVTAVLWLMGIAAILFYSIHTYRKFRKTVEKATLLWENIYECENIPSPFVMGVFSPKIYIPYHLNEEEQAYVLTHEKYHIKRCDHIVKIVAFLVLSLYWFNPFVWIAYFFACRDMEMSCDEKVVSMLGNVIKQDYSVLLLSFATNRRMNFAGPLAFGESDTGKRVKNVLRFRKPHIWGRVLGIGLVALVVLGCATDEEKEAVVEVDVNEVGSVAGAIGTDTNAGTEKINVYDELENVQIEGIQVEKADAVRHNYGEKVESAEPEELSFIQDWAVAFCNRDGKAIYEMATEESRSMLADTLLLEEHDGAYSFGWSSPWPMNANADWRIISIGNGKAVILYYAWTLDPHVTVWRSEVSYEKVSGKYQCMPEEIQMLAGIDSVEDFYQAYPYAVIRDTQMDYLTNGMGEALNKNAKANGNTMPEYEELFSPDTAVKNLLNLSDNVNAYARAYVEKDGEDGTAYVRVLFPDGYMMIIETKQTFGEDGIWVPQAYLTEDEMEAILQETAEGELIDLQEEAAEKLLLNQSSTASNKVYSIYNYFDDPHEGGLETSTVDLNGDGALEEISLERLANVGGDGGYIVHVKNVATGKEIQLPKEIAGEQYPFSTVWNENGLQVMYNDTCIANYPTDFIYEIYEKKAVILAEDALDTEQVISGDAASGYTVYKNADGIQLILKYYLSGLEGHADCFGYGLVHLDLQSDNTWNVETSFAVDLAYEE